MKRLLVVVGLVACGETAEPPRQPVAGNAPRDASVQVDAAPLLIGVITASETVDISSRFTGVVQTIKVNVGDVIEANQVVAAMDPTQQQDELRAANAAANAAGSAVNAARVEVAAMKRKVANETEAVRKGVSSQQELENAKDNLNRAEAALQTALSTAGGAAARAKTAKDLVASAELRAPFAGRVDKRFQDAGARVDSGTAILRIVAGDKRRVKFAIPPDKKIEYGTEITADVGTGPQRVQVTATIKYVRPTVDTPSQMLFVEAEVKGGGDLQPGLPAWVHPF